MNSTLHPVEVHELNNVLLKYWRYYNYLQVNYKAITAYVNQRSDELDDGEPITKLIGGELAARDNLSLVPGGRNCDLCKVNGHVCDNCVIARLTHEDDCEGIGYRDNVVFAGSVDEHLKGIANLISTVRGLIKADFRVLPITLITDKHREQIESLLCNYEDCDSYQRVLNHIFWSNSGWQYDKPRMIDAKKDIHELWHDRIGDYSPDKLWVKVLLGIIQGDLHE